jgi:hypothetical protein
MFPQELEKFLKHVWKAGVVNTAAPQRNFLAQQRGPVAPEIFPEKYKPIPNPIAAPPAQNPSQVQHLAGVARDWKGMLDIETVTAYAFRGETTRKPQDIKDVQGFHPSSTRDAAAYLNPPQGKVFLAFQEYMKRRYNKDITEKDYTDAILVSPDKFKTLFREYSTWRALLKEEELHLGRMVAKEALKGYISSTKSTTVAKGYAGDDGWVYCVLVRGGYLVPAQGKIQWTSIFGEQGIAFPGSIPWSDVYGFRKVNQNKFTGSIWLRSGSGWMDDKTKEKIYKLLSGKVQKAADED